MDQFGHYKQNYQHANVTNSRVYINRNFNRIGPEGAPLLSNSNVMYFNPNYSLSSSQHNIVQHQAIRPRIHVNPNFIKLQSEVFLNSSQINAVPSISRPTSTCNQLTYTPQTQSFFEHHENSQMGNMSRYCLVREKENKVITTIVKTLPNKQQTVKVNKYKSISLNTVKKNLASDKSSSSKINENTSHQSNFLKSKSKYRIGSNPISNNVQNTRYKFIKRNSQSDIIQGTVRRVSVTLNKSMLKASFKQTKKIIKGAMKKNNIPCPLFKKYGKCLRMLQGGSCDYLHDKKHVSICRKFLSGICHNKQCLMSHDLTDKKMPTCYFFLQGICTKEGCPYLHVKLNDKTKICSDFIKGYCEKGDKCLHRHINICPDTATKRIKTKKESCYTHINKRNHSERPKTCRKNNVLKKYNTISEKVVTEIQSGLEAKDQRYFKEAADDATSEKQCDFIKPIRCKLGILPSFIQL